jgi:hypothetical protein
VVFLLYHGYIASALCVCKAPQYLQQASHVKYYFVSIIFSIYISFYLKHCRVIAILALNYGLVAASYLTSEWPRAKFVAPDYKDSIKANGDVVLGYLGIEWETGERERC